MTLEYERDMRSTHRRCARAFTLVELLVVMGIIALLVGILLPALAAVTGASKAARTKATLNEFSKACDLFQQQLGFYPGVFPEEDFLGGNFPITGTENAILHLMGGYIEPTDPNYGNEQGVVVTGPNSGKVVKIIDRNSDGRADALGEGPTINGKKYDAFYQPGGDELGVARGQQNEAIEIPDLLDAWGTPVIYIRRGNRLGPIVPTNSNAQGQFLLDSAAPYLQSSALGEANGDQADSVFTSNGASAFGNQMTKANWSLATVVGHAAFMSGTAPNVVISEVRGSYVLVSGGEDAVFFSIFDGAGSPTQSADEIPVPTAVAEYDDVVVTGGDAG